MLCHTTGASALGLIAAQIKDHQSLNAAGPAGSDLGHTTSDTGCNRLAALGAPVKSNRDECWRRFHELRQEYEVLLPKLADSLLVPTHHRPLLLTADV